MSAVYQELNENTRSLLLFADTPHSTTTTK